MGLTDKQWIELWERVNIPKILYDYQNPPKPPTRWIFWFKATIPKGRWLPKFEFKTGWE